jgi:hypothetical protein
MIIKIAEVVVLGVRRKLLLSCALAFSFAVHANDDLFNLVVTLEPFAHALSPVLADHITVSRFRLVNKTCAAMIVSQYPVYKAMIGNRKKKLFNRLSSHLYTSDTVLMPEDFTWHSYGSLCHGKIHCADGAANGCNPYCFTYTLHVKSAYLIAEEHEVESRQGIRKEFFKLKIDVEETQP